MSQTSFLSEIVGGQSIPREKLAYFRQRLRNRLYELVLAEFVDQARNHKLTKAEITRRIHSSPSQVTRWLAAPGNWEIDTISDLLLAMGAEPAEFSISHLGEQAPRNFAGPEWIVANNDYEWVRNYQETARADRLEDSPTKAQARAAGAPVPSENDNEDHKLHSKSVYQALPA
jgi:hypothetical protein